MLVENGIRYCVIGGQGVNAYAEPLVSLDLDVAVVTEDLDRVETLLSERFRVERFRAQHQRQRRRLAASRADPDRSALRRIRIARNAARSSRRHAASRGCRGRPSGQALGVSRRDSPRTKRQKDLADIGRLIEAYPHLRERVPREVLDRLV